MASVPKTPASTLLHLIDEESSPREEDLVPHKRSSVDVRDGVIQAVDSTRDDCEPTTTAFEGHADPPSEVSPLAGTVEGTPLHNAEVGIGRLLVEVAGTRLRNEPSSSRPVDIPTMYTDERGKRVAEGGYEMGSDLDPDEVRMLSKGFTRVEVKLDGSSRTIVVPMDRDLLVNIENVAPSLGPFCSDV